MTAGQNNQLKNNVHFSHYRILFQIGEGGMSEVWLKFRAPRFENKRRVEESCSNKPLPLRFSPRFLIFQQFPVLDCAGCGIYSAAHYSMFGGCQNTVSTAGRAEPKDKYYVLHGWKR